MILDKIVLTADNGHVRASDDQPVQIFGGIDLSINAPTGSIDQNPDEIIGKELARLGKTNDCWDGYIVHWGSLTTRDGRTPQSAQRTAYYISVVDYEEDAVPSPETK